MLNKNKNQECFYDGTTQKQKRRLIERLLNLCKHRRRTKRKNINYEQQQKLLQQQQERHRNKLNQKTIQELEKKNCLTGSVETVPSLDDEESSILASANTNYKTKQHRQVRFQYVQVREHMVTYGLQCASRQPFPLSLDWGVCCEGVLNIDQYENKRLQIAEEKIKISLLERKQRLQDMGFSQAQLQQLERSRKVRIALDWVYYDHNDDAHEKIPNEILMDRYIM